MRFAARKLGYRTGPADGDLNDRFDIDRPTKFTGIDCRSADGDRPERDAGRIVDCITRTCIGVSCLMFQDGETKVTLGSTPKTKDRPTFDGYLDTPRRKVGIWTIEWEQLLETSVPMTRTRIRIWTNRPIEPDDVYIAVGE